MVGKPTKFTPECIEQIKSLVDKGLKKKEIADLIGCTDASLQVTCSRLKISLKKRKSVKDHFLIMACYRGRLKMMPLPLKSDAMLTLMIRAEIKEISLGELVSQILLEAVDTKRPQHVSAGAKSVGGAGEPPRRGS